MKKNKPFVIGLSGLSGAGKTFYIAHLRKRIGEHLSVLTFDDYYKPIEEQALDKNGYPNFDLPDALDHELYVQHLSDLIQGKSIRKTEYAFELKNAQSKILSIKPSPIIVAEGLFIYQNAKIRELLDYKVFLSCDEQICLQRRLKRDSEERGVPVKRSAYQWKEHVLPAYERFIRPFQEICDVTYVNDGHPERNLLHLTKIFTENLRTTFAKKC